MNTIKVAAVQFPLGDNLSPEDFLDKVATYLRQAKHCDLIVFPELITTEILRPKSKTSYKKQLRDLARDFTPAYITWLKDQAQRLQINILGGTTPRVVQGKIYNTAVLALTSGEILLQDKLFLTPDEKDWQFSAGSVLNVFTTDLGSLVITTCFDSEIPQVSHLLAPAQPELILIPSWTSTLSGLNRVDWSARARAIEHYAYVIKTGTVPQPPAQDHFGLATIIAPQETGWSPKIIQGTLNQAEIIFGSLDLKKLRTRRALSGYYPAHEQTQRIAKIRVVKSSRS